MAEKYPFIMTLADAMVKFPFEFETITNHSILEKLNCKGQVLAAAYALDLLHKKQITMPKIFSNFGPIVFDAISIAKDILEDDWGEYWKAFSKISLIRSEDPSRYAFIQIEISETIATHLVISQLILLMREEYPDIFINRILHPLNMEGHNKTLYETYMCNYKPMWTQAKVNMMNVLQYAAQNKGGF